MVDSPSLYFPLFLSYRFRFFFIYFNSFCFQILTEEETDVVDACNWTEAGIGRGRVGRETEGDYPGAEWNKKGNCIAGTLSVMSHGQGRTWEFLGEGREGGKRENGVI